MKKTRILRQLIASSIALATLAGVTAVAVPAQAADPVTLTMWTRSVTAVQSQDMVNAFNLEYADKIQIKLTVIPFATYLAKVSAAASTGDLPDILAANVIDGPNYTRLGLWKDITTQVKALSYWKDLAPGHIASATYSHKIYAVPHVVDASSIYYNKVLFRQAGLDPNMPPTSLTELAADAKKISALGNGIGGLYFPGNCAGCLGFVMMPSIWAQGARVLNSTGTGSFLDSAKSQAVFNVYRNMFKDGSMMDASKNETGATQNGVFESGKAGFALLGSKALGTIKASDKLEIGIAPLSGGYFRRRRHNWYLFNIEER
jgi:multiple sugar transport system substrate-binding protein